MCDYNIIFDIYNENLQIIDDDKIKHMPQLLGHFYNYLNSLILVLNDKITKKEIINRKESLLKNINIILDFYIKIDINKKISNFHINYLFIDLMTLAIIILYSYIHVVDSFNNVSSKMTMTMVLKNLLKTKYTIKDLFTIKDLLIGLHHMFLGKESYTTFKMILEEVNISYEEAEALLKIHGSVRNVVNELKK